MLLTLAEHDLSAPYSFTCIPQFPAAYLVMMDKILTYLASGD